MEYVTLDDLNRRLEAMKRELDRFGEEVRDLKKAVAAPSDAPNEEMADYQLLRAIAANSKLTGADAIELGRKVNSGMHRR